MPPVRPIRGGTTDPPGESTPRRDLSYPLRAAHATQTARDSRNTRIVAHPTRSNLTQDSTMASEIAVPETANKVGLTNP